MKTQNERAEIKAKNIALAMIASFALIAVFVAFDQYREGIKAEAKLEQERSEMRDEMYQAYKEIDNNLAEILAHENVIGMVPYQQGEGKYLSPRLRIKNELEIIESLLKENHKLMDEITTESSGKDEKLTAYENRVSQLEKRLKQYKQSLNEHEMVNRDLQNKLNDSEARVIYLNNEVFVRTTKIDEQTYQMDVQKKQLSRQADELAQKEQLVNTAYFAVGSYKDLNQAGILQKEGGVAGIGGTKVLQGDAVPGEFVRIDRRNYTIIPVHSRKAELITAHDPASYEWVKDEKEIVWLKISDPELFWDKSKYLVIVTKEAPIAQLSWNK